MEASHVNQLQKLNKLSILLAMSQKNYTTTSSPDSCDGWLGTMIGDALWYPLWSDEQVDSTAVALAAVIGNQSKTQSKDSIEDDNNRAFAILQKALLNRLLSTQT